MISIKYKNLYDKFINHYKDVHVNPWHEISEDELNNLYNELINLGALTIGEEIGTPLNSYGNCNWINIDNHYFASSSSYFYPTINYFTSSKEEFQKTITPEFLKPHIFKPDILIEQSKEDYINNVDTILNYTIDKIKTHSLNKKRKEFYEKRIN